MIRPTTAHDIGLSVLDRLSKSAALLERSVRANGAVHKRASGRQIDSAACTKTSRAGSRFAITASPSSEIHHRLPSDGVRGGGAQDGSRPTGDVKADG